MTAPAVRDEREPGATFAPGDIGYIDFESRSATHDLRLAGAYEYARHADAIVLAYAIGDAPVHHVDAGGGPLDWFQLPDAIRAHHKRVQRGEAIWTSWNAGFDKAIWTYSTKRFPPLRAVHIIDAMAQGAAAGLPADLAGAAKACKASRKLEIGRDLVKLFCMQDSTATPQTHPDEWAEFCDYACADVEALRSVFRRTRQLPMAEWREYWAMEAINERGVVVDRKMVSRAAALADEDKRRSADEIRRLTKGYAWSVDHVARLVRWLLSRLAPEGCALLVKREEEQDSEGLPVRPPEFALTRARVEKLLAYLGDDPRRADVIRVLQLRLYGGSKTPAKYRRMLAMADADGVLRGQYIFNGAGQTGRASSRGAQVHNLARDTLPYEYDAIEALLAGCSYEQLAGLGDSAPVARKLALLIRPAFVAPPCHALAWSDWSQIEARVLPWLAGGDSPGALARLKVFSDIDADPSKPDLYTRTAAALSHCDVSAVTKPMRQRGKVAELALGFGGGLGSLQSMGAGYGLHVDEQEGRKIVADWRKANKWCVDFWGGEGSSGGLWGAIVRAIDNPHTDQHCGRIMYVYLSDYLGGSLLCRLPSGRYLTYRAIRYERVQDLDDDDSPTGNWSTHLRFARGYGRVKLWHGMACISAGATVLTERGWLPIERISSERVWDGEEWVAHGGVVCNGVRTVMELDGVWMTPDHQVLTTEGWANADSVRHNRAPVRLPDGHTLCGARYWAAMADAVRVRQASETTGETVQSGGLPVVRVQGIGADVEGPQRRTGALDDHARHVPASGLSRLAIDAGSVPIADASVVAQLRRSWHQGVQTLADIRAFLGRYGSNIPGRTDDRANEQQSRVLSGELQVGDVQGTSKQHTTVYDILDAGPRNRFVVAGTTAPFLVHNCENVVQAVAADFLRGTLVRLEAEKGFKVVLATHDEVVVVAPVAQVMATRERLREVMRWGFDWSEGLPVASDETVGYYYSKNEKAHGL